MTEPEPPAKVEENAVANGSGPPPEDKLSVTESENKEAGVKTEGEVKEGEEMKNVEEKKHKEENGTTKVGRTEESKDEIKTEDVNMAEADDANKAAAEDVNMEGAEDVKMTDVSDVKNEEKETKERQEAEGVKQEEGEKQEEEGKQEVEGEHEEEEKQEVEGKEEEEGKQKEEGKQEEVEKQEEKGQQEEEEKQEEEGKQEEGEEEEGKKAQDDDVKHEGESGSAEKKEDMDQEGEGLKKKRSRVQKASQKGEAKVEGNKKAKGFSSPPVTSIERPVRERKTVERLVEVIEKEPHREFQVEKGRGTPLKDIPNVAYKLSKKKPADIKLIHQTLFGRKGKAVDFKNHILQFSGFVWHESDEKQRAKMKEKLDKYVKDTLLDLCDLFDLSVSRANSRKEDLVTKLLDFLVAPHATTEVLLSGKDQASKSRKRKRVAGGSSSKSTGGSPIKHSRKVKRIKSEDTPTKGRSAQETDDDEEDDDDKSVSDGDKVAKHSGSEAKENESEDEDEEDEDDRQDSGKGKSDMKRTPKRISVDKGKLEEGSSSKKGQLSSNTKSPKTSSSKQSKVEEDNDVVAKVFSRKKRNVDSPKKKLTSKSDVKEKDAGKRVVRGRAKQVEVEHPTKEELRSKICEILKEVDFNTATFTDILKKLAAHYEMDLTPRKASLKLMIQEELTKLAEAAEEDEDDEENDAEDDGKEEKAEPAGREVEA